MNNNKHKRQMSDKVLFKHLWKYIKVYKWRYLIAIILTLFMVAVDLLPALLEGQIIALLNYDGTSLSDDIIIGIYQKFIDSGYQIKDAKLTISFILVGMFLGIIVVSVVTNYFTRLLLHKTSQRIVNKIRIDTFIHIENLSIAQINKTPVGKLVTRVTSDVAAIYDLFTNVLVNLIGHTLKITLVIVMMLVISPVLTGYLALIMPILIVVAIIFNKTSRRQHGKVRDSVSNINAFLSENLSGMKITQIFNQENKKYDEFNKRNTELKKNSFKEILIFGLFRPFIYVLYVSCQIIVLSVGFVLLKGGSLTVAKYVSFFEYIRSFFDPIQQLADQFEAMQSALASAERVFILLDTPIEILDSEDAIEIESFKGKIEFDHVWFAYNDENWILKDVSFTVNPNDTVAFVGATGAGKTTILALIVRNYDIQKGEIRIDDIPIKKIKIESLRRHIGQMLQDVFLFSGSLKNNITLRDEKFTDEDVMAAAKYVNADKLINKLDGKLDYQVYERGANFSSGERQLISFARTIIHKPNIMILDEATANIDTETEVLIQDSLEKMMNVASMLIVAHRLSTVQHADKIIVLDKGVIIESGTHQELLKHHGHYYNLYELQYKHMESDK